MSRAPKTAIEDRPEPDRVTGAPHPRETTSLIGHHAAEQTFLMPTAPESCTTAG